jgi:formylglycine-generating enzyme required for sulfatase activity
MMNDAICRAYKMDYYTALTSEKNVLLPNFRLPTEAEWEYAALSSNSKQFINDKPYKYFVNTFPWQYEYLTDNKGNYLANFGAIFDQNSMQIKSVYEFYDYDTDGKGKNDGQGYFYSSPVKTFPPNGFGLYDMAGNVAEWVMDRYRPYSYYSFDQYSSLADTLLVQEWESWENYFIVYETDSANLNKEDSYSIHYFDKDNEIDMIDESNQDFDSRLIKANDNESIALQKLVDNQAVYNIDEIMDTTNFKSHWLTRAKIEIHNAKVVEANPNARIVKGGSWATGPAYMQCGSREILSATKTKSMVGFRICMTYIGDISISVKK